MTDKQLSPAAQAVLDAYGRETGDIDCVWHPSELKGLAAVLRAVADQVVPIEYEDIHGCWYEKKNRVREQFLAIANELEAL
jgi:hypothetical protein